MTQRKLLVLLIVTALLLSGCIRAMVNSSMNKHYSQPNMVKIAPPPDASEEAIFYHNIMQDYGTFFASLQGESPKAELTAEQKLELEKTIKEGEQKSKKNLIATMMESGSSKIEAERMWRSISKIGKGDNTKSYTAKVLPTGANQGTVTTSKSMGSDYSMPNVTASVGFMYMAQDIEEARTILKDLYRKVGEINFESDGWTIKNEDYFQKENQRIYDDCVKIKNMIGPTVGEKLNKQYQNNIDTYEKKLNSPIDSLSYNYIWESDVISKLTNLPETDQLNIMFSAFDGGEHSSVSVTIMYIKMESF